MQLALTYTFGGTMLGEEDSVIGEMFFICNSPQFVILSTILNERA